MSIHESTDSSSSDCSTGSSDWDNDLGDLIIVSLIKEYQQSFISKTPCRTSVLMGRMYTRVLGWS